MRAMSHHPSASARRVAFATLVSCCALAFACNSGLPAPTKSGPAPEYEDPGATGADASAPLNESFGDQVTALFQGEAHESLAACQSQAESQGKFQGTIQVHIVLRPDGTLVAAEPRNDSGLPPALVECLTKTLGGLHFPAPGGARNLAFEVPLRFMGTDTEAEAHADASAAEAADAAAKPKPKPKAKGKP